MSCDSASGSGCLIVGIEVSRWKSVARAQRQWWKVGVMVAEQRSDDRDDHNDHDDDAYLAFQLIPSSRYLYASQPRRASMRLSRDGR